MVAVNRTQVERYCLLCAGTRPHLDGAVRTCRACGAVTRPRPQVGALVLAACAVAAGLAAAGVVCALGEVVRLAVRDLVTTATACPYRTPGAR